MASLSDLRTIVGAANAVEAAPADAIDGVQPKMVVRPAGTEEVSAVMKLASGAGWRVAPRGAGTKLGWGNPPSGLDLLLDMSRMNRVLEHAAGDLVASFEAGVRLADAQVELARAGQMLALDPAEPNATIGGVIAANASGPRRFRYGTTRDLLIGVTVVLSDGTIAKAGGKVVKNVAGYDLAKLVTGSLGTLAVIAQAIFRLHPRPAFQRLVEAEIRTPEALGAAVQRVLHSDLTPTAVQLSWPAAGTPRLGLMFEGVEPSVVAQAATAADFLRPGGPPSVYEGDAVEPHWQDLIARPAAASAVRLKVTFLPADLPFTLELIQSSAEASGISVDLSGPVGNGIVYVTMDDPGAAAAGVAGDLRSRLKSGHVVVEEAPLEVKRLADVWGPVGDSLPVMRRVKEQFDPGSVLNPGRFVGGI